MNSQGMFLDDLSENVDYDAADYPVYIRRSLLSSYVNHSAPAHWHNDPEFIYIYSGEMNYSINGEIVRLQAGEGIFVNARQIHFGFSHEKECDFLCVIFDPAILMFSETVRTAFVLPLLSNSELPYLYLAHDEGWQQNILNIFSEIGPVSGISSRIFSVQASFLEIWRCLYDHMPVFSGEITQGNETLTSMRKMLNYIKENYSKHVTLRAIADSGNISVSSCCKLFSHYLQNTPMNFTAEYRIKISMQLLRTSDDSITAIAGAAGFSGSSYFSETFRAVTGMSPRDYRRKEHKPENR